jgi:hypothetical protein
MPPLQPLTGSILGKRRNRDSDDDPRYRSPDERERDYDRERGIIDTRTRRHGGRTGSAPSPVYSPPSRMLPAITASGGQMARPRTGTITTVTTPRPRPPPSAFPHARPCTELTSHPTMVVDVRLWGSLARSPESSQSPTLPSPPVPPYYNNLPPAPPSNENYRVASPLRTAAVVGTTEGGTRDRLGISIEPLPCLICFRYALLLVIRPHSVYLLSNFMFFLAYLLCADLGDRGNDEVREGGEELRHGHVRHKPDPRIVKVNVLLFICVLFCFCSGVFFHLVPRPFPSLPTLPP